MSVFQMIFYVPFGLTQKEHKKNATRPCGERESVVFLQAIRDACRFWATRTASSQLETRAG